MTRRGWWLVLLGFLIPGSAQILAGNRRLGRIGLASTLVLWALAVLGLLFALLWPTAGFSILTGAWLPDWLSLLRPVPLLVAQGLLLAYAVLWVVLAIDTLRLVRLVKTGRGARFGIAMAAVVLPCRERHGGIRRVGCRHGARDPRLDLPGRRGRSCRRARATTTSCCSAPTAARAATRCGSTASRSSR